MCGFAVAAAAEVIFPWSGTSGLFGQFESSEGFAILLAGLLTCSIILAVSSPIKLSRSLLEPIMASLTSKSRSQGSVTGRNVDGALDSAMESVFNPNFVREVFPIEAEFNFQTMLESDFDTDSEEIPLM